VMVGREGESGDTGEERWGGAGEDDRMELNVNALSSGVAPRTEDRGWVGRPKSLVGWMIPVVTFPFSSHQVFTT
jgi:hypothetical protein